MAQTVNIKPVKPKKRTTITPQKKKSHQKGEERKEGLLYQHSWGDQQGYPEMGKKKGGPGCPPSQDIKPRQTQQTRRKKENEKDQSPADQNLKNEKKKGGTGPIF